MRTSLVLGLSTMLGAMGWMSACGSTESTCEERGDCTNPCDDPSYAASHPDVCPDAGTAGTGGDSSTGGSSGGSGEGGTAGASGTGGEAGTGGADAGDGGDADAGGQDGGDAEAEPYCDPTWMPEDDSCVVDDAYGVFVSPSGSDVVGCGGQSNPCATLGYGMLRAKAEDRRVYACGDGGTYAENLTVDASLDGVLVLGGFRCSDWSYEPATIRSRVEPSAGAALQVDGLSSGLQMRSFVFASADGSVAGESSIAGYVRDSQNVHFRDCVFEAGAGADGADGTAGDPGEAVPSVGDDQQGENGACGTMDPNGGGGWLADFVCAAGGSTRGGAGGSVDYEANGDDGKDGDPETNLQNSGMGLGGTGGTESIKGGADGGPGSNGNPGTNGGAAESSGTLSSTGYDPANGQDGTNGHPGQGGGGGGGSWSKLTCVGPSGGAGGMGGCGGFAGTKGTGGGASIALVAWSSTVTLEDCTLTSSQGGKGGNGGNGGVGSSGKPGHIGGANVELPMEDAGKGGLGGNGGPGGSGSGASGGPSYALVFHGTEPAQEGTVQLAPGAGGEKGIGGQATGGNKAADGEPGGNAGSFEVN